MNDQDIYTGLSFASELKQVGVDGLRTHVEAGTWKTSSPFKHGEAIEVIRRFDVSKAAASSAKRDSREEETLSIARRALLIAEDANSIATRDLAAAVLQARWAKWAAIIAMLAAAITTKDQILALIFSNP